jgi:hypothetical protein
MFRVLERQQDVLGGGGLKPDVSPSGILIDNQNLRKGKICEVFIIIIISSGEK